MSSYDEKITKKKLDRKVAHINSSYKTLLSVNYAECYGGYCLENVTGTQRYSERMSSKEMYRFLQGMELILIEYWKAKEECLDRDFSPFSTTYRKVK